MTLLDRRSILFSGLALGAMASTPSFARRRGFFARHGLPVGVQLYTVGAEAAKDLDGTLARLAAIGYRTVELAGLHGHRATELRQAADKAGLRFTSIHLQATARGREPGIDSDPARIAAEMNILGIKDVVLPLMPWPEGGRPKAGEGIGDYLARVAATPGGDIWKRTAALLNARGALLKREGLRLGYHNHNVEFAPVDGRTGFDILMAETDPALVSFEMDAGWVVAAGLDPIDLLRRYPRRFRQMHVKDVLDSTVRNFAIRQDPTEVGSGIIPWAKLLPAAYAAGIQQFYVEQEPPFAGPKFDALTKSFAYLTGQI
ncbi:sugar phosphate isomerase/epimerase family protein [Sphingobium sp. EP60837]|uniref:sugar phosphate isomerase/epimerase family protein n=1 Tax=Sphingobium sp. EP60837 TaxID=1855519 RepID=UPI0007DCCC5E|nr:sugar phosphate isomerase/epimerase [Sphingobium sp. EP60837]ANI78330.1 Myo-inosose-2 dehydratase [Sphingobium sp. EP60837]